MANVTLNVEGMSCQHCVSSVKRAVSALEGVSDVNVDLGTKKVSIEYDNKIVSPRVIKDAIEDQGYDVK